MFSSFNARNNKYPMSYVNEFHQQNLPGFSGTHLSFLKGGLNRTAKAEKEERLLELIN